jgi:hypothetical protein
MNSQIYPHIYSISTYLIVRQKAGLMERAKGSQCGLLRFTTIFLERLDQQNKQSLQVLSRKTRLARLMFIALEDGANGLDHKR